MVEKRVRVAGLGEAIVGQQLQYSRWMYLVFTPHATGGSQQGPYIDRVHLFDELVCTCVYAEHGVQEGAAVLFPRKTVES